MKTILFPIVTFIAGTGLTLVTFSALNDIGVTQKKVGDSKTETEKIVSEEYKANPLLFKDEITCRYPQVVSVDYDGSTINHRLNNPETNPIVVTYAELDTESAVARSFDATQTVSEYPIIKIYEDEYKMVLL
jgi:hypothetical protein